MRGERYLLDDVEGKLQPLPLQHGNEVLEEDGQVLVTVSEGDQDGHLQHGPALGDAPVTPPHPTPPSEPYLPVRYAVLWFPMSSKLNAKEFGELEFSLLHGNLCHVHIYKALYGPHTHTHFKEKK